MENPLISILIANYNNGKFLEECIQSVFKQTYNNWEIIIVDDASIDESKRIFDKHRRNDRIHIYFNNQNEGCGFTKRRCASIANGSLLAFLDPDDTINPQACEILVNEHGKCPNYGIIYSNQYICDENLNIKNISSHVGAIPKGESQLTYKGPKISAFAVFKKSFYEKTQGISSKYRTSVDQDLYFKLEEVGPVKFINKPLYNYRHHTGSISLNENRTTAFLSNVLVSKDAYERRNKYSIKIKNLSYWEFSYKMYRYHIWQAGTFLNKSDKNGFYKSWISSFKYFYWDKKLRIPRLLLRCIKENYNFYNSNK